ncbi:hypothetical protein FGE21_07110 [Phaeobacter sp. B1627]|nr:hypothetical protein FGE21_07110 [Phaeobacter sp. B1627]
MALAGVLLGVVAGLITAAIGLSAFGLPVWVCLAIYVVVGVVSAFSVILTAYFLQATDCDWPSSAGKPPVTG